jgi:nucleoside phosphorylase
MGVPFLAVRAVADQANEHGPRDFALNLARAMRSLATVLRGVANAAV